MYDLVVIGGGPGGYSAALYGASAGLKVALVEKDALGGTCLNRGCIPAKAFLETAAVKRHVDHSADFGIEAGGAPTVNFAVAQARKQKIVAGLVGGIAAMCKGRKVDVFNGVGSLGAGRTVDVSMADGSTATISGDAVILAAGSVPRLIPGFEVGGPILTSDEVLDLEHVPERIAVIGGGVIGIEFASAFADLGAKVTVLEFLPKILPGLDADLTSIVVRALKKRGVDIKTGVKVSGWSPAGQAATVQFGEGQSVEVDAAIVAVGRRPYSDQLGLAGTGVKVTDRGFIEVDQHCQTGEPGVYAVGDVVDTPALAHVGYAEAIVAIKHMLGENPLPVDYDRVPMAIYSHPEVAWAGLGEDAAKEQGLDVVVGKHPYKFNSRAQIVGETDGVVKVVAKRNPDGTAGQVLGVHMVGPWVTEQLSGGYLAVNWEATVDEVAAFIQPHPSLSELFGETMLSLTGRDFNG